MSFLGLALIVGGAVLLVSGLIFLLPTHHKQMAQKESVRESLGRIHHYVHEMRRDRVTSPKAGKH
jgi:hypothetical protein